MLRKKILFGLILLTLSACASNARKFHALTEAQPQVIEVSPTSESFLGADATFRLRFSQKISAASVDAKSVALIPGPVDGEDLETDSFWVQKIENREIASVSLSYRLDEDGAGLEVIPQQRLADGLYYFVVNSRLTSSSDVPFNQQPGTGPKAFVARFFVGDVDPEAFPQDGDSAPKSYGPTPEFVRINEALYDGLASETDGECFVELYASPGSDLSDYRVNIVNGSDGGILKQIILPYPSIVPEDGIFVIADLKTNSSNETRIDIFHHLEQFDLQNGPDAIQILDRTGQLLDALTYGDGAVTEAENGMAMLEGTPALDVAGGHSVSRTDGLDSGDNSVDFSDLEQPSPGVL